MSHTKKVVIIGLGGVASNVARPAKKLDPSLDITILKEEDLLIRCAVPYIATDNATLEDSVKGDESMKHGNPEKAKVTSSVLQGVDVLVGRKFSPNLPRLLKKFVCVVVRTEAISNAIEAVHNDMDKIVEEKNKGEDRKHIVLGT